MNRRRGRPGRRLSLVNVAFTATLFLYVLLIAGIVVEDFWFVAATPEGRKQLAESLQNREVLFALRLSVWTSSLAAVFATAIAVASGYVLSRGRFPGVRILDGLIDVPIVLPPLVFGLSLLIFFQRTYAREACEWLGVRFVHEPAGIVLVQTLIVAAFGTRMMKGTFDGLDPRLAAVAQTLGCSRTRAFFSVTLAQARSGVVAALVMAWAQALGLYGPILAFVGATTMRTEILPTRMFMEVSNARAEAALALALMMIVLTGLMLLVVKIVGGRSASRVGRIMGG